MGSAAATGLARLFDIIALLLANRAGFRAAQPLPAPALLGSAGAGVGGYLHWNLIIELMFFGNQIKAFISHSDFFNSHKAKPFEYLAFHILKDKIC